MPDWQNRIDRETPPGIRAEHALRYAAAAPIVQASAAWLDLGCGTGLAAADGLGATFEGRAVLIDVAEDALALARQTVPVSAENVVAVVADLSDAAQLDRVREALPDDGGPACVTCFETIEHLETFAPLVELLVELAQERRCTVVLSVPNDAFWAVDSPHHKTTWGEGAVEELRRLLPAEHRLVRQVALQGSALVGPDEDTQEVAMVSAKADVPTHLLLAFGERADALAITSRVLQTDLDEQRRWERQRESDLRYYAAQAKAAESEAERLLARVQELESRLGKASATSAEPPSAASASSGGA